MHIEHCTRRDFRIDVNNLRSPFPNLFLKRTAPAYLSYRFVDRGTIVVISPHPEDAISGLVSFLLVRDYFCETFAAERQFDYVVFKAPLLPPDQERGLPHGISGSSLPR